MSAETLRKAAAIVRERGLAKGEYQDDTGRVCLFGAWRVAVDDPAAYMDEHSRRALEDVTGQLFLSLWNDAAERTADDVAAALEAAAARLDAA